MIPEFPQFKSLELSDKKEIEKITQKYPPYSDFNFANLWSWDLKGEMGFSIMNKNLIVKFTDYLSGNIFLSFFGENMANETAQELILFSEKNYKNNILKLIPETIANLLDKSKFNITSDMDSKDYVYAVSHLANINAWPQNRISKGIRQFVRQHPDYIIKQHSLQEVSEDSYLDMFKRWSENKNIKNHLEFNEYKAFKRIFQLKDKNIKIVSLYLKDMLIGFSLFEILENDYAISHFAKADTSCHPSVQDVLNWEEAKFLNKQGVKYYNWEQSLGIQGLEKAKMKYQPCLFLNKFLISIVNK